LEIIPIRILAGSDPEVKEGKPAPDPYLVTFKRIRNPPKSPANCIVFEDSINGAKSGKSLATYNFNSHFLALDAGMNCILIPQEAFMSENTKKAIEELRPRLTAVLNSMEEFQPELYGLPAFN
jgi:pseudouridine-5'-monophosphatase